MKQSNEGLDKFEKIHVTWTISYVLNAVAKDLLGIIEDLANLSHLVFENTHGDDERE